MARTGGGGGFRGCDTPLQGEAGGQERFHCQLLVEKVGEEGVPKWVRVGVQNFGASR